METVAVKVKIPGKDPLDLNVPKDVWDNFKDRAAREFGGDLNKAFHAMLQEGFEAYEREEAEAKAKADK